MNDKRFSDVGILKDESLFAGSLSENNLNRFFFLFAAIYTVYKNLGSDRAPEITCGYRRWTRFLADMVLLKMSSLWICVTFFIAQLR